jgi:serine/threonine protein kinase
MAPSANNRIHGFDLIRRLPAVGGQGVVYEAVCTEPQFGSLQIGDHVALKVMTVRDSDPGAFTKFAERTEALVAMSHPNIVRYHGCFADELALNPIHGVVTDFLSGQTLRELLDKRPQGLDVAEVIRIVRSCLSALIYAEGERKIIHRDIKPGNIFICEDGTARLIDFELARQADGGQAVSTQGNLRGAFDYMAPDFLEPTFHGDEQSDVFSLAVCLHEALTGQPPYQRVSGDSLRANISFHDRWRPADAKESKAVIQIDRSACLLVANMLQVLEQGLAQSRDKRYASFLAFNQAFSSVGAYTVWARDERYDVLRLPEREGERHVIEVQRISDGRVEKLSGQTLRERLLKNPHGLDADIVIRIFQDFLSALVHAAREHRVPQDDIRPENIFICEDGSTKFVPLDLARQRDEVALGSPRGEPLETVDYKAPDFLDPSFEGDERSAVFSVTVCLHEALSGRKPYPRVHGDSRHGRVSLVERWNPVERKPGRKIIQIDPMACPPVAHLHKVLEQGLEPNRDKRYATFGAVQQDFESVKLRSISNGEDHYELLRAVGRGGYGEVFKARRLSDGLLVAIKHLLKAENSARFDREAGLIQGFSDSRFVKFIDYFTIEQVDGLHSFLIMEYLPGMPGGSIRDRLRVTKQGLPFNETIIGFIRFADGLHILHQNKVYHRDIKPSNLYLPPGEPERACIMDFGVARDANGTITNIGIAPGTFNYMPPEVAGKEHRGDAGMDIFALGLCLYEALTNRSALPSLPADGKDLEAFIKRAAAKTSPVFDHPLTLTNFRLHGLLVRMTDPDVKQRERDASRVAEELRDLLPQAAAGARPTEAPSKAAPPPVDSETALTRRLDEDVSLLSSLTGGGTQKTIKLDEEDVRALQQPPTVVVRDPDTSITNVPRAFPWRVVVRAAVVVLALSLTLGIARAVWLVWPIVRQRAEEMWKQNEFKDQVNIARRECDSIAVVRVPDEYGSRSGQVRDVRKKWTDIFASVTNDLSAEGAAAFVSDVERVLAEYDAKALEIDRFAQELMWNCTNAACQAYASRPAVPASLKEGMESARAWEEWAAVLKIPEAEQVRVVLSEQRRLCLSNVVGEIVGRVVSAYQSCHALEELTAVERTIIQPWRKQADEVDENLFRTCAPIFAGESTQARKKIEDAQARLTAEEKKARALTYLRQATAYARELAEADDAEKISHEADSLRAVIGGATNVIEGTSAREAEAVLASLNKRLDFLKRPVPLVVRNANSKVRVLWSQISNRWQVVSLSGGDKVYPGAISFRFERPDYLAIGPTNRIVKPGCLCEVQAPSERDWVRGEGLIALEQLEELRAGERWDLAEGYLGRHPVLIDNTHSQRWCNAVSEVRSRLSTLRDGIQARTATLDGFNSSNFFELNKLVWPVDEAIQKAPAVSEAQGRLVRRFEEWVRETATFRAREPFGDNAERLQLVSSVVGYPLLKELSGNRYVSLCDNVRAATNEFAAAVTQWVRTACGSPRLDQRAQRLSEAKSLVADKNISRIMDVHSLERLVDQERGCCILTLSNKSGQETLVRVDGVGVDINMSAEASWTGRVENTRGEISLSAIASRCMPWETAVSLKAGGWCEVLIPKFEPLPGVFLPMDLEGGASSASVFMDGRLAELGRALVFSPGVYGLECRRPDYEAITTNVVIRATETNCIKIASLPWNKVANLLELEACEAIWAKNDHQVTAADARHVAEVFPRDWRPENSDTHKRKAAFERKIVSWYEQRIRDYLVARARYLIEMTRLDYQIADLETGATRKEAGEMPEWVNPERVSCPEWVISGLSKDVREAWRQDGLPLSTETQRALELSKDIHTIIFRAGGETVSINNGIFMFAQIVELHSAYALNRSDRLLAKYLYEKHTQTLKSQIQAQAMLKGEDSNRGKTARAIIAANEETLTSLEAKYALIQTAVQAAAR